MDMTRVALAIKDAETGFVMQEARHAGFTGSPVLLAKALADTAVSMAYAAATSSQIDPDKEQLAGEVLKRQGVLGIPYSSLAKTIELMRGFPGPGASYQDLAKDCGDAEYSPANPYLNALMKLAEVIEPERLDVVRRMLVLQDTCYGLAERAGWWLDLETGEDVRTWPKKHLDNWVSAKLMLTVTEVSEAMEGHRKGLNDTHLTHRPMLEVELADAVIRVMDLAGGLNLDVPGAIVEKLAYNLTRQDHQLENRKAAGGKSV